MLFLQRIRHGLCDIHRSYAVYRCLLATFHVCNAIGMNIGHERLIFVCLSNPEWVPQMVYWRQAILAPDTSCVVLLLLKCCLRRISRRNVGVGANYVVALDGRLATDPRQSVCPLAISGFYDRSMAVINFCPRCLDLHSSFRIVKNTPTAAFHLLKSRDWLLYWLAVTTWSFSSWKHIAPRCWIFF